MWSKLEREIIESYRRQHITQQFNERIKLQQNITETYELDINGRPVSALVFGDGMTAYTGSVDDVLYLCAYIYLSFVISFCSGNTPRQQQRGRKSKKSTHFIASRVIGVEVHCGPVHGTLLYYTDDLTKGGSNTIIEVTRQGKLFMYASL